MRWRTSVRPLIARCEGIDDVAAAIRFARERDLVVAVPWRRPTVWPGFSTCDGGIVVDLSRMRGLTIDPERRIARAEGGAHLSQLDQQAQAFELGLSGWGLWATPASPVSRSAAAWDACSASWASLSTICARSTWLRPTVAGCTRAKMKTPDLFWGIRGAGANFGVVNVIRASAESRRNDRHAWMDRLSHRAQS